MDTITFGVWKMHKTRENIKDNHKFQVVAVAGKQGYRLTGKAALNADETAINFTVEAAQALL